MANKTNFRSPQTSRDDSCDENEPSVIGGVGRSNMCTVWGPTVLYDESRNSVGPSKNSPKTAEKCASRRVLERFSDFRFQPPVSGSPDFYGLVIRLSSHELPNRIKAHPLDKTIVLVQLSDAL